MPSNTGKEDLRSIKTGKALNGAMFSLLENRNFGKITVSDICMEAMISRATFYAHFTDKYDLLQDWLICLRPDNISKDDPYELMERTINQFIHKNASVIKNLVHSANDETLEILFNSFLDALDIAVEKKVNGKRNPKYVVLSNFFAGGMLCYSMWQVKNKFPPDVAPMNVYLNEVIQKFQEWNS